MIDNKTECYITGAAILIWLILFSAGAVVPSQPYRAQLDTSFSLENFVAATLVYTPSNMALLSLLAGFIGGCMSKLMGENEIEDRMSEARQANNESLIRNLERRKSYLIESPMLSMFRGFLTYIGIISGILLLITDPFEIDTAGEYVRIAGLISGLAFLMGYDPTQFEELISKFSQWKPNSG